MEFFHKLKKKVKRLLGPRKPLVPSPSTANLSELTADFNATDEICRKRFLIRLTKTLHRYGHPVHRTENIMQIVSKQIEVNASISVLPSLLIIAFGDDDLDPLKSDTRVFRVSQVFI